MSGARVVGIRGATCAAADTEQEIHEATRELVTRVMDVNALSAADLVSMLFTATPDLHAAYPATAARSLGLSDVALMGAQEMDVPGGMARVIRVLVHAYSDAPPRHVFLREATGLRPDLSR